jgi:3-hydroxyacyl-CoA dehydrogenase
MMTDTMTDLTTEGELFDALAKHGVAYAQHESICYRTKWSSDIEYMPVALLDSNNQELEIEDKDIEKFLKEQVDGFGALRAQEEEENDSYDACKVLFNVANRQVIIDVDVEVIEMKRTIFAADSEDGEERSS